MKLILTNTDKDLLRQRMLSNLDKIFNRLETKNFVIDDIIEINLGTGKFTGAWLATRKKNKIGD